MAKKKYIPKKLVVVTKPVHEPTPSEVRSFIICSILADLQLAELNHVAEHHKFFNTQYKNTVTKFSEQTDSIISKLFEKSAALEPYLIAKKAIFNGFKDVLDQYAEVFDEGVNVKKNA